jgi:hypothetical protein
MDYMFFLIAHYNIFQKYHNLDLLSSGGRGGVNLAESGHTGTFSPPEVREAGQLGTGPGKTSFFGVAKRTIARVAKNVNGVNIRALP